MRKHKYPIKLQLRKQIPVVRNNIYKTNQFSTTTVTTNVERFCVNAYLYQQNSIGTKFSNYNFI